MRERTNSCSISVGHPLTVASTPVVPCAASFGNTNASANCWGTRAVADAALDGGAPSPDAVTSAIGDIRTTMEIHLAFEESVLLPLLRADLPSGHERANRLLQEHIRQREVLADMHREARAHPELPTLAAKLVFLTSWLLMDMAEEEHSLLVPEVIRDDQIVIDQTCG